MRFHDGANAGRHIVVPGWGLCVAVWEAPTWSNAPFFTLCGSTPLVFEGFSLCFLQSANVDTWGSRGQCRAALSALAAARVVGGSRSRSGFPAVPQLLNSL